MQKKTTAFLLTIFLAAALATPAQAATSTACTGGGFQVVIGNSTYTNTKVQPGTGRTAFVRGTHVTFSLDLDSFTVRDYTLTGAPNPLRLVSEPTVLFASKVPDIGDVLTSQVEIKAEKGGLLLQREGGGVRMKLQAKDCAQGGIFQLEPEAGRNVRMTHTLGPNVFYYTNPFTGKINIGDGALLRAKDSPQVAAKLYQDERMTIWDVASGGRMGGVIGEDAVEASAGATSCVQDCQAQNQIHGSVPIPDPVYESDGGL